MRVDSFLTEVLGVLQMKSEILRSLAQDKHKTPFAFFCLLFGAFGVSLGFMFFPLEFGLIRYQFDFGAMVFFALKIALLELVSFFLLGILAQKLFQSKLSPEEIFRIFAVVSAIHVLSLFPYMGLAACLWSLFLMAHVLHFEAGLSWSQAVGLLASTTLLLWILSTSFFGVYGLGLI